MIILIQRTVWAGLFIAISCLQGITLASSSTLSTLSDADSLWVSQCIEESFQLKIKFSKNKKSMLIAESFEKDSKCMGTPVSSLKSLLRYSYLPKTQQQEAHLAIKITSIVYKHLKRSQSKGHFTGCEENENTCFFKNLLYRDIHLRFSDISLISPNSFILRTDLFGQLEFTKRALEKSVTQ